MKKLLNKTKLLFIIQALLIINNLFSQDITNTLGSGGVFTLKDASTNYLTLNGSTGQVNILKTLRLESTTGSSSGVLLINGASFLHNYGSSSNTFLGKNAGNFTLTGQYNTAVGEGALFSLTSGSRNSAFGFGSLSNNTSGSENSAFGHGSLSFNTTGNYNSAFGYVSLARNTSGSWNSGFGGYSLSFNTSGNENSAFGYRSLTSNAGGSWNSAFGYESLESSTLNYNTALGYSSGSGLTSGIGNVCIGFNSNPSSFTANNQVTLGNNQVTSLRCAVTTITSLSDARDKKNIKDLALGIGFLMKVKPRQFNWDKREWYDNNISDGTKMQEAPTAGFISQELDSAQVSENAEWLQLVLKDDPDKLEANSGNLLPVIVKAIQELKKENDMLKDRNSGLRERNTKYKKLLGELKQMQDKLANEIETIKAVSIKPADQKGEEK